MRATNSTSVTEADTSRFAERAKPRNSLLLLSHLSGSLTSQIESDRFAERPKNIIEDRGSTKEKEEKAKPSRARKALAIIGKRRPDDQYDCWKTESLLSFLRDIKVVR